jgi:hypothetical protein
VNQPLLERLYIERFMNGISRSGMSESKFKKFVCWQTHSGASKRYPSLSEFPQGGPRWRRF